jgi:hypothetical protein
MLFDTAGNLKVTVELSTSAPAAWTPANWTGGFVSVLTQDAGFQSLLVTLNHNASVTAGAVTWQGTYDGINWVTIPASQVLDPSSPTFAQIANPYTFVPSAQQSFLILVGGYQALRAFASTPMTGAGASISPFVSYLPYSPVGYALTNGSAVTQPISGAISFTAPQHVINDASAAVIGHVISDTGSVVAVSNFPVTQPVSGTITANQGTSPWVVSLASTTITGTVAATQSGTWNVGTVASITAALPTGANTIGKVDILGNAGATLDAAINGAASTNALWGMHAPSTAAAAAMATPTTIAALTVANVKASAGNVYGLSVNNTSGTPIFLQFYNTAGTPVLGTSVIFSIPCVIGITNIPIAPFAIANFATGIGVGASTSALSTGTPSVAPAVTVFFK